MFYKALHLPEKCTQCGYCTKIVACPGSERDVCIGCGACVLACPSQALVLVEDTRESKVSVEINGRKIEIPERISVKEALKESGYTFTDSPEDQGIYAQCEVGGCLSCSVEINGEIKPSCITEAREGMKIKTILPENYEPKRIVMGFMGHPSGGVGTPWNLRKNYTDVIEIVCYTAGCNFRCPQCQNWPITFTGVGDALTPKETALKMQDALKQFPNVKRLTVSGGESTLNKPWLLKYLKELTLLFPDEDFHFHIDTNGSLLTKNYIDDLVSAGMTDIGIDLKALNTETFMRITGVKGPVKAEKYKENAWKAVEYLRKEYKNRIFTGVGIPYNKDLISLSEIENIGKDIYNIDPAIQVTLLDYQPAFRSRIPKTTPDDMKIVYNKLIALKLETVICQTSAGYLSST